MREILDWILIFGLTFIFPIGLFVIFVFKNFKE
jgi:hypothetical protein